MGLRRNAAGKTAIIDNLPTAGLAAACRALNLRTSADQGEDDEEWLSAEEGTEHMSDGEVTDATSTKTKSATTSAPRRGRFTDLDWIPEDEIMGEKAGVTGGWGGDDEGGFTTTCDASKHDLEDIDEVKFALKAGRMMSGRESVVVKRRKQYRRNWMESTYSVKQTTVASEDDIFQRLSARLVLPDSMSRPDIIHVINDPIRQPRREKRVEDMDEAMEKRRENYGERMGLNREAYRMRLREDDDGNYTMTGGLPTAGLEAACRATIQNELPSTSAPMELENEVSFGAEDICDTYPNTPAAIPAALRTSLVTEQTFDLNGEPLIVIDAAPRFDDHPIYTAPRRYSATQRSYARLDTVIEADEPGVIRDDEFIELPGGGCIHIVNGGPAVGSPRCWHTREEVRGRRR